MQPQTHDPSGSVCMCAQCLHCRSSCFVGSACSGRSSLIGEVIKRERSEALSAVNQRAIGSLYIKTQKMGNDYAGQPSVLVCKVVWIKMK